MRSRTIWVLLLLLVVAGAVLWWRQRLPEPTVTLDPARAFLGHRTTLDLRITSPSGQLARLEARLTQDGRERTLLAEAPLAAGALRSLTVDARELGLKEGKAELRVWAQDGVWRPWSSGQPKLVHAFTVDLTPPTLHLLAATDYVRHGGAGVAVYRVEGASRSGVQVGATFFPGVTGLAPDPAIAVAFFTIPYAEPPAPPTIRAEDEAGNQRVLGGLSRLLPARFPRDTIRLSEAFLRQKVGELAPGVPAGTPEDLLAAFLRINREGRREAEARIQSLAKQTGPTPRWTGAFRQQPNSKVFSMFPEERTYVLDGRVVDTQLHLGFDLASRRHSEVQAANAGKVLFVGPLGIYGNTVILEHGLGLATLYAHLSEILASEGQQVGQGETLGRTGQSGLAGGDHLHFAVLIHGVYSTPVEWWDPKWIKDHIEKPLTQAGLELPGLTPSAEAPDRRPTRR